MRRTFLMWMMASALAACDAQPAADAPAANLPEPAASPTRAEERAEPAMTAADGQDFTAAAAGTLQVRGDVGSRYDIDLPTDILFDFDRAELRGEAMPLLEQVRRHFATHPTNQVHVRGHTDAKGGDQHNYVLSMKRATAVCDWLKRESLVGPTMCIGRGEAEPLKPNTNPDGSDNAVNRQLNRRVTVSVVVYPNAKAMLERAKAQAQGATRS